MPVIRFNNATNYNASDIARRAQGRAVYANSLVNQKTLEKSCLNRVVAGPAATTSYSGATYIDQRVGNVFTTPAQAAEILLTSPCQTPPQAGPTVYPSYTLQCDDSVGIQIMASGTFTSFTFTTTSLGRGVVEFQYFLNGSYVSSDLNVLGVDSNLITPPAGIDEVRYVFRCTPQLVSLECIAPSKVLQWTIPYSFQYISDLSGDSTTLTLYKHPISDGLTETHIVYNGQTYTPSPAWGYDAWSMEPCIVGSIEFTGSTSSVLEVNGSEGLNLGSGDFTVEWYQYYNDGTSNTYPTLFCYKTTGDNLIMTVYINNSTNSIGYFETAGANITAAIPDTYRDTWCHFAVCRSSNFVYLYQNGSLITSGSSTMDFSDETANLFIGNDQSASALGIEGKITSFRLTPGYALYPGGNSFTPPTTPLLALTISQLLLDVSSPYTYLTDSSPANRTVIGTDVSWSSSSP
jgi:hypothetical protein